MSPTERAALRRLEDRLFGEDGEGGAVGTIRAEVRAGFGALGNRVSRLETQGEVGQAVEVERRTVRARIVAERRWRAGLALGVGVSVVMGVANFLVGR